MQIGTASSPFAQTALDADLAHLSHDPALTAKIMRKRQDEMQRRTKLLNPRMRQNGMNHAVLDAQVAQKRAAEDAQRVEEAYHARSAVLQEEVAQAFETMKAAGTRERHKNATDFSLTHLTKDQRREFYLSDPNELKKERVRTHAELNACGPSSMQTLGEDVEAKALEKRQQQHATGQWLKEQWAEKEGREADELDRDRTYDREVLFANDVRTACEQATLQDARDERYETAAENRFIAEQHRQRRNAQQERNIMANETHRGSIMNSDRMKESIDYAIGSNGNLLRTEYKRLTVEEEMHNHHTNAHLVLQKRHEAAAEAAEEAEHAANMQRGVHILGHIEGEKKRAALERRLAAEEYNRQAAAQKRANAFNED